MYVRIANGDEATAIPIVNGYEKVINVTFSPFISIREHTLVLWIAKYPVPVAQKFSNLARLFLSISLYVDGSTSGSMGATRLLEWLRSRDWG